MADPDRWRSPIDAHVTVAGNDAYRSPSTGLTDDDEWRRAFGPKKTPQGVLQTPGYNPAAVRQSQVWAENSGVRGPLDRQTGIVTGGVTGAQVDPYTHNVDNTRTDDSGGYYLNTTGSNAASIGRKYASRDKEGYPDPNPGYMNQTWQTNAASGAGDPNAGTLAEGQAQGSAAHPIGGSQLDPFNLSLNQPLAGTTANNPGMPTDLMGSGPTPPLALNSGQLNPGTSLYTPGSPSAAGGVPYSSNRPIALNKKTLPKGHKMPQRPGLFRPIDEGYIAKETAKGRGTGNPYLIDPYGPGSR